MIYEHFSMRLHDTETWTLRTGSNALAKFVVGSVSIPAPIVKQQEIDVPGTSGRVDFTEMPRVTFDNKTVEVVLQGQASNVNMKFVEETLSSYQGRVVDFTFDDPNSVVWFVVGRVAARFDKHRNKVYLSFNCEPFRYGATEYERTLTVLPNYERDVNTGLWSLGEVYGGGGDLYFADDTAGFFAYYDSEPGAVFERSKTISGNNGKYLAFGIVSITGGDVWFEWTENGKTVKSRTMAKVVSGKITMKVSIDGSYYEWLTLNGLRQYRPVVRCTYILSDFLPMSDDAPSGAVSMTFPSNTIVHPTVKTLSAPAVIICDGVVAETKVSPTEAKVPRIALPNSRADFSEDVTKSIYVVIPKTAGTSPNVAMRFRMVEVF